MTKNITKSIFVDASTKEVYEALMDNKKHEKLTGGPAKIDKSEGGKFSLFGGAIHGVNTKLEPNSKIEQKWRAENWEADYYSLLTISLETVENGTKVSFNHSGVPKEHLGLVEEGWEYNYWSKMEKYFSQ